MLRNASPLHRAAAQGDVEALKQLLAAGGPDAAAAEAQPHTTTPLHRAAAAGRAAAVRLLLTAHPGGAWVPDQQGRLPLHCAIEGQHASVVGLLLDAAPESATHVHQDAYPLGCSPGCTPLHAAAQRASSGVVRLLLDAAPHTASAASAFGHTPLHIAVCGGWSAWNGSAPELQAPWHIYLEMVQLMLPASPGVALHRDWTGDLPLHNCALAGAPSAIVHAVAAAAPEAAQVRNFKGQLPLGAALACARDKAREVQAFSMWSQAEPPGRLRGQVDAYLACACALLEHGPTDDLLGELVQAGHVALPLFAELAAPRRLSGEQWAQVPHGAPGLGGLLPAVLARSPDEAACLVRRLYRRDRRRLWEYLRCLARLQRQQPGLALPPHVVWQTLSGI